MRNVTQKICRWLLRESNLTVASLLNKTAISQAEKIEKFTATNSQLSIKCESGEHFNEISATNVNKLDQGGGGGTGLENFNACYGCGSNSQAHSSLSSCQQVVQLLPKNKLFW